MTAARSTGSDALRHVLARIDNSEHRSIPVSASVRQSWERSADRGLQPGLIHAPYVPDSDDGGRIRWAAAPVMTAVSADLPDLPIALLLTDSNCHVIERWTRTVQAALVMDDVGAAAGFVCDEVLIGTNSIGLAAFSAGPAIVRGFEHYADALTHVSCASSPVFDPLTGQLVGIVNLTSADPAYSPVIPALVGRVVHETEQRLLTETSAHCPALHDAFVRARSAASGPVVALDAISMYVSTAASTVIDAAEHPALWAWAERAVRSRTADDTLRLRSGSRPLRCRPVCDGPQLVGAIVWLADPGPQSLPARYGYALILTASERSVAEHVAAGLTNRETAAALFVSPHTVDYHLRQIYRKLNLQSRVELARLVSRDHALADTRDVAARPPDPR
jgi:DNA-binding CsgD family transcriptional regulator